MKDEKTSTIAQAVIVIAQIYGISPEDVIGKTKQKKASEARYIVYSYLHYDIGLSSNVIGKYFKRSRYNILRGIRILRGWMEYHAQTKEKYNAIIEKLKGDA